MPTNWRWDFATLAAVTNQWPPAERPAGRFASWALWTVQSFDYLPGPDLPVERADGGGSEVLELARIRWAAASAATSIDLCAALLGIRHLGLHVDGRAAALTHLAGTDAKARANLARLPNPAQSWVTSVQADPGYHTVGLARNPFTHSALARNVHVTIGKTGPREYFAFGPNGTLMSSNEIVETACAVARLHVSAFFNGLRQQLY